MNSSNISKTTPSLPIIVDYVHSLINNSCEYIRSLLSFLKLSPNVDSNDIYKRLLTDNIRFFIVGIIRELCSNDSHNDSSIEEIKSNLERFFEENGVTFRPSFAFVAFTFGEHFRSSFPEVFKKDENISNSIHRTHQISEHKQVDCTRYFSFLPIFNVCKNSGIDVHFCFAIAVLVAKYYACVIFDCLIKEYKATNKLDDRYVELSITAYVNSIIIHRMLLNAFRLSLLRMHRDNFNDFVSHLPKDINIPTNMNFIISIIEQCSNTSYHIYTNDYNHELFWIPSDSKKYYDFVLNQIGKSDKDLCNFLFDINLKILLEDFAKKNQNTNTNLTSLQSDVLKLSDKHRETFVDFALLYLADELFLMSPNVSTADEFETLLSHSQIDDIRKAAYHVHCRKLYRYRIEHKDAFTIFRSKVNEEALILVFIAITEHYLVLTSKHKSNVSLKNAKPMYIEFFEKLHENLSDFLNGLKDLFRNHFPNKDIVF